MSASCGGGTGMPGRNYNRRPNTSGLAMTHSDTIPFAGLNPERILDAIESIGYRCDGGLMALNSYENRVWQIGVDDGAPVIAKFYRPGRWTDAQIAEEHAFTTCKAQVIENR